MLENGSGAVLERHGAIPGAPSDAPRSVLERLGAPKSDPGTIFWRPGPVPSAFWDGLEMVLTAQKSPKIDFGSIFQRFPTILHRFSNFSSIFVVLVKSGDLTYTLFHVVHEGSAS